MAYNQVLKDRVQTALAHTSHVEEKKMFGGVAFMVNGKMCINVGKDRIMFRIDPAIHEQAVKRKGCRTVTMRGREYRGFVYINEDRLRLKRDLDYWIGLSLDFNNKAKASKKQKKK
jgi:TfoX/Sxy family transcriptional regulator of competence genes